MAADENLQKRPGLKPAGLLLAILLGLLAAFPFFKAIPEGGDIFLHFYRLVQLDALVQQGIIYSRWAPDLAYGFGYPIFNYYAPLTYYLAEIIHLAGLDLQYAFLATFIIAFVVGAVSMYLWVRDLFGDIAGLVAAAVFVLSPYLMIDALQRGALAEHVALSLLPLNLFVFRRMIWKGGWLNALASTLAFACLLLTHNITALVFSPLLLIYIVLLSWHKIKYTKKKLDATSDTKLHLVLLPLWFLLLGVALAAFYWIPALFEREQVQIIQAYGPSAFNYESNFQSIVASFALPFTWDPNLINRGTPIALSLLSVLLGAIGSVGTFRYYGWGEQRFHVVFGLFGLLFSLFMTVSISQILWDTIPLLAFVQFPWRFLGLATVFVALLAGAGADTIITVARGRLKVQMALPAILIGLVIGYILPWQFADYPPVPPVSGLGASLAYEKEFGTVGTTSTGEYLPVNVKQLPEDEQLNDLVEDGRFLIDSLPQEAKILESVFTPLEYQLTIESPESFFAIFNTFFYEGWRAYIDDNHAPVTFTEPTGLLQVEVPAGRHQLQILFESTAVRDIASALSIFSLVILVVSLAWLLRQPIQSPNIVAFSSNSLSYRQVALITAVLATIVVLKGQFLEEYESPLRRSRLNGQTISGMSTEIQKNFDDKLILLGMESETEIKADQPFELSLYWQPVEEMAEDYSTSVVLVNEYGNIAGQSDKQHPGVIPTSRWAAGKYAEDKHLIELEPGTPPGSYTIEVAVYRYNEPQNRLNILDVNSAPIGQSLSTQSIEVQRPDKPADASRIEIATRANVDIGTGPNLLGYSVPEKTLQAGQALTAIFYWQATEDLYQDLSVRLDIADENGESQFSANVPLVPGFPTSRWMSGDLWQGIHQLTLPASIAEGQYNLTMAVDSETVLNLTKIDIHTPEHSMEPPAMPHYQEEDFSQIAKLIGYDMPSTIATGETLPVTFLWQSLGETRDSYKSFVQLLNNAGTLVVGSDAIPGDWQRPTTGWIASEYITDPHYLAVPLDLDPGSYRLIVGFYDEDSLERLTTSNGEDALILNQEVEISSN